jgi:cation diffusion facilitator family transporter
MEASTLSRTDQPVSADAVGQQRDVRLRAGAVSLVVGIILLGVKCFAYTITGSTAILSDALESIVNVVAAVFALAGLTIARWPADRSHPYGHGKIEFFSAAFEGGLIAFAAVLIIYEALRGLLLGLEIRSLNVGVLITLAAGFANGALGWFLIRTGERHHSLTLVADGKHVMSDFITSLGITVGLGLVLLTGRTWLDPLVAVLVGVQLAFTGFGLVRHAADGLLDAENPLLLKRLLEAISANLEPGIIRVHFLRAIRSGRFTHVDAHLVIPEFWTVEKAHEVGDAFEQRVFDTLPFEGEIVFHLDPCQRRYCSMCDVANCPIRMAPFQERPPLTLDEVTRREDPKLLK